MAFCKENSVSCGFVSYGEIHNDSTDSFFSNAPFFSYERLFKTFNNSSSLGGEVTFLVDPLKNEYSLSVNFKAYTKQFEGLYFGFSPFSDVNFGNLFLESPYLNYAIGTIVGFRANIKHISLKSQVTYSVSFYDKQTPFKMVYVLSLGYMW